MKQVVQNLKSGRIEMEEVPAAFEEWVASARAKLKTK